MKFILKEMEHLLKRYYVSQERVYDLLMDILRDLTRFSRDPRGHLAKTKFLSIQRKGYSQEHLLGLVNQLLNREYNLSIDECGNELDRYVYLDDCLYSGNTIIYDFFDWLKTNPVDQPYHFYFLGIHTSGLAHARDKLSSRYPRSRGTPEFHSAMVFSNDDGDRERYDCLWPTEPPYYYLLDAYLEDMYERCQIKGWSPRIFRPPNVPRAETIFSSPVARKVVEWAFLRVGCELAAKSRDGKIEMRPLGYEKLESLGFGALFISYRNISNNCPLALWWGVKDWYPLFPRIANVSSRHYPSAPILGHANNWDEDWDDVGMDELPF